MTLEIGNIITTKARGGTLYGAQLRALADGAATGSWTDTQLGAMCAALYAHGLNDHERAELCGAMIATGDTLEWRTDRPVVDKHSTGGVGDKISLVMAPLCAELGMAVPMLSGRGLGHTGGTLDKLEAVTGYRCELDNASLEKIVEHVGCFIAAAGPGLAPADKKLYAIRDHTGCVAQRDLIATSIMSKKLASGADHLVVDIKWGSGAFCATTTEAAALADAMSGLATSRGVTFDAVLSDMNIVCGHAVGNAAEVREAVSVLQGNNPDGVVARLSVELTAVLADLAGLDVTREHISAVLTSGAAFERFANMCTAQGGDITRIATANHRAGIVAHRAGLVNLDAYTVGVSVWGIGAGRATPGANVDVSAGAWFDAAHGDWVDPGDIIGFIEGGNAELVRHAAVELGDQLVAGTVHEPCNNVTWSTL